MGLRLIYFILANSGRPYSSCPARWQQDENHEERPNLPNHRKKRQEEMTWAAKRTPQEPAKDPARPLLLVGERHDPADADEGERDGVWRI